MNKFVHIVFGDSAAGLLKYYFASNESEFKGKVINLRDDHSIGPVYEIDTEVGLRKRIEWVEKMLKKVSLCDYFEDIYKEFVETYKTIKAIEPDTKIIIWHGENTGDQVGLRYLSSELMDRELYEVNVSKIYIKDYNGNRYRPRAFGECSPEEIGNIILAMKKIDQERCNRLIKDWEALRVSKDNLRILNNDEIIGVEEGYYDNDILLNCGFNFKKAARVIGMTMGRSKQLVGDAYIDYRIRKLIEDGKIEYRGKLQTMRDFEVRVFGSLKEFFVTLFKKDCEIDEDGFYHYLLEEKENDLVVDTTHITKWDTIDLSNKLILDYDDNNIFSLVWFKDSKDLISINHILVDNAKYKEDVYEDENGKEIKTENIILFSDDLINKQLEVQIKPYISVCLKRLKA